jgi:hypothetical protein
MRNRDASLDNLLFIDGERFVIDADGKFWVRFEVKQCEVTAERPHGLKYSLTLHGEDGARLLGFDNAHRSVKARDQEPAPALNSTTNTVANKSVLCLQERRDAAGELLDRS